MKFSIMARAPHEGMFSKKKISVASVLETRPQGDLVFIRTTTGTLITPNLDTSERDSIVSSIQGACRKHQMNVTAFITNRRCVRDN